MSSFVLNGVSASANYMHSQLPYHSPDYYQQSNANQLIPPNTTIDYAAAAANFPYGYSNNHHSSFHSAQSNSNLHPNNLHPQNGNIPPISIANSLTHNGQSTTQSTINQQLSSSNLPSTTTSTTSVQNHLSSILPPSNSSYPYSQHHHRYLVGNSTAPTTNSSTLNHQQSTTNYHSNSDLLTTINSVNSSSTYNAAASLNSASVLNSPLNHNAAIESDNLSATAANNLPNNYYNPFNSAEFNRHLSSYNNSPLLGNSSTNSSPGFSSISKTANNQFLSSIQSGQNAHLNHHLNNHLANQHLNNLTNHNGTYSSPLAALSNAVNNSSFLPTNAPFQCKIEPTPDSPPESTSSNSLNSITGTQNGHHLNNSLTNGNSMHHDYRQTNINSGQLQNHPSITQQQLTLSTNDSCSMMSIDNNSSQNVSSSNQKAHIYPWMKKNGQINPGKLLKVLKKLK